MADQTIPGIRDGGQAVDQILQDIGRKCGEDVSAAIGRNMLLFDGKREAMIIATYGAATAIGAANGAFSAYMDGPDAIDANLVDQLWAEILRPMILGDLSQAAIAKGTPYV
jgi:hypothetical protein